MSTMRKQSVDTLPPSNAEKATFGDLDNADDPVESIPREALRGLPTSAIRLISNLCREVFELSRRLNFIEDDVSTLTHSKSQFARSDDMDHIVSTVPDCIQHIVDILNYRRVRWSLACSKKLTQTNCFLNNLKLAAQRR